MKPILRCLALSIPVLAALSTSPPVKATEIKNKEEAVASIEKRKVEMIKLSDQIWAFAETALREHKSSKALSDYAEDQGFKVERGVAGHGCGHNLFGVASLGAAVAVKELMAAGKLKGMIHTAKTLAATMVDLFEDARQREAIQAEFKEKTRGFVYKPYISDGPPPLPKQ